MSEVTLDKVAGLIGFAVRSGEILYGLDRISAYRGRIHLLIVDENAGQNTRKGIDRLAAEKKIVLWTSKILLEDITHKKNCKAIAILNKNLAHGIQDKINPNYIEVK